jgi:hypothetical protein
MCTLVPCFTFNYYYLVTELQDKHISSARQRWQVTEKFRTKKRGRSGNPISQKIGRNGDEFTQGVAAALYISHCLPIIISMISTNGCREEQQTVMRKTVRSLSASSSREIFDGRRESGSGRSTQGALVIERAGSGEG